MHHEPLTNALLRPFRPVPKSGNRLEIGEQRFRAVRTDYDSMSCCRGYTRGETPAPARPGLELRGMAQAADRRMPGEKGTQVETSQVKGGG